MHRYQLRPVGFEIGKDSRGPFVKLRLVNDQPQEYQITRTRFETEGYYSDNTNYGPVEFMEQATKLVRFDVVEFHDIAIWVSGTRSSAVRRPRRHLATFSAAWVPSDPWQSRDAALSSRPASRIGGECDSFRDHLLETGPEVFREKPELEVWPAKRRVKDRWKYFVAVSRDRNTLWTGPYLRRSGTELERFYTGAEGVGWYSLAEPRG